MRHRGVRISALATVVLLAACGGPTEVTVRGVLRATGGPSGATQPGLPGTVIFQTGTRRWRVDAAANGFFSARLAPDRYEVSGSSPQYGSGQGLCRAASPVTVTAADVTGLLVACSRR